MSLFAAALMLAAPTQALDWDSLSQLAFRITPVVTGEMNDFVKREVRLRNCPVPPMPVPTLKVDVAVLVDENGGIRTTVPRAIQCPSVEQYAAALVAGFARNNLLPRVSGSEQWYRTSVTFAWAP